MMSITEIKERIASNNMDDIPFEDIIEVMNKPGKYKLTFGEVMRVADIVVTMLERIKNATSLAEDETERRVNDSLREDVSRLEQKVEDIQDTISKLKSIFSHNEDEEDDYYDRYD